jgi:Zn-dependent protease
VQHPHWNRCKQVATGALTALVILGSEWGHNLAHAAAARWIGKPMDALLIFWGMPLVIYYKLNDVNVSPAQHIFRALGGPVWNAFLLLAAVSARKFTRRESILRDAVSAAVGMNTLLTTASLLPIPGIDGGPVLKWSLVTRGHSPAEADRIIIAVNRVTGIGLGAAAGVALKRRSWLLAGILAIFTALSFAIGFKLLKEE